GGTQINAARRKRLPERVGSRFAAGGTRDEAGGGRNTPLPYFLIANGEFISYLVLLDELTRVRHA
ncbi:MAG TPA: hypothetical protein PL181_11255, partial [bacterium]|nr:hypothetical protein [bacterium]